MFEDPSYAEKRSVVAKPVTQPDVNNFVNKDPKEGTVSESHPSLFKGQLNTIGFDRKPKSVPGIGGTRANKKNTKNLVRKLLERNSTADVNSIHPIEEVARDLVQFIQPVRKLLSCKINKKSLNLLRMGIMKEHSRADEANIDVFDNIFN